MNHILNLGLTASPWPWRKKAYGLTRLHPKIDEIGCGFYAAEFYVLVAFFIGAVLLPTSFLIGVRTYITHSFRGTITGLLLMGTIKYVLNMNTFFKKFFFFFFS